jgi:hypothetical protein
LANNRPIIKGGSYVMHCTSVQIIARLNGAGMGMKTFVFSAKEMGGY